MNVGGSQQQSQSTSASQGSQFNQSFVDPSQQPFLDFLRTAGQDIAGGQIGQIGGAAGNLAGQLGGIGQQFLGQLGGIGQQQGPGSTFLQERLSQQNPFLNEQISQLGSDIGQQFQESILPGIRRGAQVVGGQGGGRQGVAEGIAATGASDAFARGAGALRFGDVQQRQQAATALNQNQIAQQSLQAQSALGGLGSLQGLFNLGLSPFQAQFAPLQQLASILGGPTVLQQGAGQQSSTQQSTGSGSGFNFGLSGTLPFLGA